MNAAVPFIQHQDGQWQVTPEATRFFKRLDLAGTKLVVVAVGGPYRSGKSWLLGCMSQPPGRGAAPGPGPFAVGNSVRACTKGIWMHCLPPNRETGKTVLLLDCEGLGSLEQNNTFDSELFSLGILLSSVFVLNTQGSINENALEQLELVVQFSRLIHIKEEEAKRPEQAQEEEHGNSLEHMKGYFPEFWWVLRDFSLALEDEDGNPISSNEYLEDALRHRSGAQNERSRHKNEIRRAIREAFPARQCFCMVRPVADERQLRDLGKAQLREEFRQQILSLSRRVHTQAPTKQIQGQAVTSRVFVSLAQSYVQALNTGSVPTIESAWANALRTENQKCLELAEELTRSLIGKFFVADKLFEQAEIRGFQQRALEELRQLVQRMALGETEAKQAIWSKTEQRFAGQLQDKVELNTARVRQFITSALERGWKKLGMTKLASALDLAGIRKGLQTFSTELEALPALEQSGGLVSKFLGDSFQEVLELLHAQLESHTQQHRKQLEQLSASLQQAELRAQKNTERQQQEMHRLREQASERLREAERKLGASAEQRLHQLQASHREELQRLQQQNSQQQRQLDEQRMELTLSREEQSRALSSHKDAQQQSSGLKQLVEDQRSNIQQLKQKLSDQLRDTQRQNDIQQEQLDARTRQLEEQNLELLSLRQQVQQHQKQARLQERQLQDLQQQMQQIQQQQQPQQQAKSAKSRKSIAEPEFHEDRFDQDYADDLVMDLGLDAQLSDDDDGAPVTPPTRQARKPAKARSKSAASTRKRRSAPEDEIKSSAASDSSEEEDIDEEVRSRLAGSRKSLAGSPPPLKDPASCTIQQLRQWLNQLDVAVPQVNEKKQFWVDLVYKSDPRLAGREPPAAQQRSKRRK